MTDNTKPTIAEMVEAPEKALTYIGEVMKRTEKRLLQQLYLRVCKDSGYRLDATRAAILAGQIAGMSPLLVWVAMGSLDYMERGARGEPLQPISAEDQP